MINADASAIIPSEARSDLAELTLNPGHQPPRTDPPLVQLETRGVTQQPQGEFWARQSHFKNTIVAKLREAGEHLLAAPLANCHTFYTVVQCCKCGAVNKFPNRCDHHECPECQPRLAHERVKSLKWWLREVQQPKHVTLTCQNVPFLHPGHVAEFKAWLVKLRRSKIGRNWQGGLYSLEVTNKGNGWHLHAHLLIEAPWIDSTLLKATWQRITGGMGYIVKVRDCRGQDYLEEVCKYAAKGSQVAQWTGLEIAQFIRAFDHNRTFGVFGSLYTKRHQFSEWIKATLKDTHMCTCGCQQFRYFTELEWQAHEAGADDPRNYHHAARSEPANTQGVNAFRCSELLLPFSPQR